MSAGVLCPVCRAQSTRRVGESPYWACPSCDVWFQHPLPSKVYIGAHEPPPEQMPDEERAANVDLARRLAERMRFTARPNEQPRTLDIGAKLPVLADALARNHNAQAVVIEHEPIASGQFMVDVVRVDFEAFVASRRWWKAFDLVTLIHTFEHFARPLDALSKIRRFIKRDGRLFIRMPDHSVPGYERDLTPGHYTIHPYYHCLQSVLECCAQLKDQWAIEERQELRPGQSDFWLAPIDRRPLIGLGMMVKNEERDLPRCLDSVLSIVDHAAIVDTGSTDGTGKVAADRGITTVPFYGASERNETGDWTLWDFAKARDRYCELVEAGGVDWLLWMDADDALLTPNVARRLTYWTEHDMFGAVIQLSANPNNTGTHFRLWKTEKHVRFGGRVHEWPLTDGLKCAVVDAFIIRHDGTPHEGAEDSNARNDRILARQWQEEPSTRCAFYLACNHRDGGRAEQAIDWFTKRIEMGDGYFDEWLFAHLYKARVERAQGRQDEAEATLVEALERQPDWAELWMERAWCARDLGRHAHAMEYAFRAMECKPAKTMLWREPNQYTDQPRRMLSWCHSSLGNNELAYVWAVEAQKQIGGRDADWDQRVAELRELVVPRFPAIVGEAMRPAIALHRPGAIGDVLMTLNIVPMLREANPDHDIHYFCHRRLHGKDALGSLFSQAGVDLVLDFTHLDARRKDYERVVDLIGYPVGRGARGYPERPMEFHLLQYFANEMGITVNESALPSLTLRRPARVGCCPVHDYITIQNRAGWSKYKEWPADQQQLRQLTDALEMPYVFIDERVGLTLAEAIAVFANARMHVGVDSFCNHLTNYFWTDERGGRKVRGVIAWGSTQASAAGYDSNINISRGLTCQPCFRENPAISRQPRGPCINIADAKARSDAGVSMLAAPSYDDPRAPECTSQISVDEVLAAVHRLWEETA